MADFFFPHKRRASAPGGSRSPHPDPHMSLASFQGVAQQRNRARPAPKITSSHGVAELYHHFAQPQGPCSQSFYLWVFSRRERAHRAASPFCAGGLRQCRQWIRKPPPALSPVLFAGLGYIKEVSIPRERHTNLAAVHVKDTQMNPLGKA